MANEKHRVCPVEKADSLDSRLRRWLQNPQRLLKPYVRSGMTVMDFGCGPGFFTLEMARMVGLSGRVVAVDLQEGMLEKVKNKIKGTDLEGRILPHQCLADDIACHEKVDFALVFYVAHETPDQAGFFSQLNEVVRPGGQVLLAEPSFHVSRQAFQETLDLAQKAGFEIRRGPKMLFSRAAVLVHMV